MLNGMSDSLEVTVKALKLYQCGDGSHQEGRQSIKPPIFPSQCEAT